MLKMHLHHGDDDTDEYEDFGDNDDEVGEDENNGDDDAVPSLSRKVLRRKQNIDYIKLVFNVICIFRKL